MTRRRILFVTLQNSVHVARWIRQIADQDWDLHFFPTHWEPPHEDLAGVTIHWPGLGVSKGALAAALLTDPRRALAPFDLANPLWPAVRYRPVRPADPADPYGPATLARVIDEVKPDLIHSMEFQKAAYKVLAAKELAPGGFPPWLATNWGSDIYYYRTLPEHRPVIERLLRAVDFYSCECERDVRLARELGLVAPVLPVFPNSGGFDLEEVEMLRSPAPPSRRRMLMVKGYQHFAGRAMTALDAVERCADLLTDWDVMVFAGSPDVKARVRDIVAEGRLRIRAPDYIRHQDMLRFYGYSRAYLGVNISDAISTSLLESMAMGAFPVQTNTSCCDEWIEDGVSGFAIPPDDLDIITDRLRRALTDDALVDRAAGINAGTIRARLDQRLLRQKAVAFYEEAFRLISSSPR